MKCIIFFIFIPLVYSELHSFITAYNGINGEISLFFAITFLDGEHIDYYDSNTKKLIPIQDWMKDSTYKDMWKRDTEIREEVQQIYKNNIPVLMERFNQSGGVHTYRRMYGCFWDDETGESQGFDRYTYDGEDFISLDVKKLRYNTSVPQAIPTVRKWNNDRKQLAVLKRYYNHECVYWLKHFLALKKAGFKRRELHSFITTYTGKNEQTIAGTPEFSAVTTLDKEHIDYYDSNTKKLIPIQDWMKDSTYKDMWKRDTEIREEVQQIYKNNIPVLMERFNQSGGVHTYQRMYGCDWDDETGESQGFDQYGYDGEDFILLYLKEDIYITPVAQAIPTVQKWNNDKTQLTSLKQYYNNECVHWLKELLKLRKGANRITAPEVSLLRKDPSSPVVCHATGFYPSGVTITWFRNGLEHHEDVDLGELLPNEDGTFQKTTSLHVSPDEWENNQFSCVVEHQGKTIQKTDHETKSNNSKLLILR
ncbi:major histocompatibility complex class I-related gene protein-like [Rhinichthys klamathensis goyatoka]|uniref:major histocompatibility complex class I-related gene protein-like n=1 Tax=Rhinichthys klamathensis goyatoka TaxID=3034132 RepID=UPI0024B4D0EF|nr:major histocompatibility complex class I-related gene protein-like [Rhinichthys klamathensis goyatoka]